MIGSEYWSSTSIKASVLTTNCWPKYDILPKAGFQCPSKIYMHRTVCNWAEPAPALLKNIFTHKMCKKSSLLTQKSGKCIDTLIIYDVIVELGGIFFPQAWVEVWHYFVGIPPSILVVLAC